MSLSPAVILYDANSVAMAVENGVATPVGTRGLIIAGSDGTNTRFIRTAADGTVRTDPTGSTVQPVSDGGGSLTVDGAVSVTGSVTANAGTNLNTSALALDSTLVARSVADNAAFTDGTTRVTPAGFILDEAAGTALTEDDAAAARIDSKRAQVHVLEDATTRGQRAVIKPASTPAVATDTALVVAVSPNNTIGVTMAGGGYGGQVEGRAADGVTPVGNPVLMGGSDGTNAQTVLTDTLGRLVIAPTGASSSTKGFSSGRLVQAATTISPIRSTTYTEQSSNAQRSVSSANANDSSAGTGARTIRITYYTATMTGPFTTDVTMNGTTAVATSVSDICFIEKIEVLTVGSTGSNVGIITLFVNNAGGGGTIWTIAATENKTHGAHHYCPTGKTCFITGLLIGIKGAGTTGGFLRAKNPTVSASAEVNISDDLRAPSSGQSFRSYGTPIAVTGPARITVFVWPDSTSSRTYFGSFDFYEE